MPIVTSLPKGCTSMRGSSQIARIANVGGELARNANSFYMLNVKRESLSKKKASLEKRLLDIGGQLQQIERDIQQSRSSYEQLYPRTKKQRHKENRVRSSEVTNMVRKQSSGRKKLHLNY